MQAHEKGFFTEEDLVEIVTGRNAKAKKVLSGDAPRSPP